MGDSWVNGREGKRLEAKEMFVCSSVTYDLENVGCPRPSCVQMCEWSSKAQGFYGLPVASLAALAGAPGAALGGGVWPSCPLALQMGRREMWEVCWAPVRNSEVKTGREKTVLGRKDGM